MEKYFLTFLLIIRLNLSGISPEVLKKYPYQLITNDYGILNESNLKKYTEKVNVEPFKGNFNGLDYWQCFPTKNITVWYEKETDDPYDKMKRGDAHITISITPAIIHDYVPRRSFSSDFAKKKVSIWKHFIQNQQYACIGGIYVALTIKLKTEKKSSNMVGYLKI